MTGETRGRRLPMVGGSDGSERVADASMVGPIRPDQERILAGWEHRFVAAGARAEEMIELYRELGYDVAADPVTPLGLAEGCPACFTSGGEDYHSIYTRRPAATTGGSRGAVAADARGPSASPRTHATRTQSEETPIPEAHATWVLREEHRQILQVADALEELLNREPSDAGDDRIAKCIRFIRLFGDACHHGKEEDLLFPALVEEGMPGDSGPIAVMLHEHRLGRQHAAMMADSIEAARAGDERARARLGRAGRGYVLLIRGHILKEDNVLFEMADQMILGPRCAQLCQAYDRTGAHTFAGCTKAELEELGREILAGI